MFVNDPLNKLTAFIAKSIKKIFVQDTKQAQLYLKQANFPIFFRKS